MPESDTPRNDAGQFAESGANLTGEAYEMHKAGYVPKPEEPAEKGPEDSKELAESFAEMRGHDPEPEPVLGLTKEDDGEPKEALTQQQFAEYLGEDRRAHESLIETVGNAEVAAWADNLRAELGPELLGEPAKEPTAPERSARADAEPGVDGLAPDIAKALAHPQVREAVEAELSEASRQREAYTTSLQVGQQMLQATVSALAPQLDGMPLEHWPQAIQMLGQVDPVRAELVAETLNKWGALQQAQQHAQHQQAHVQHQQFEATVMAEDARLTELFGGDKSAADEATSATISYLSEHGIPRDQMLSVFKSNPVLSTAEARRTIWEAAKYRDIQKAKVTAAARPAPAVQRPGIAASSGERQASALDARTAQARGKIDGGRGDVSDLGALIGALRRA